MNVWLVDASVLLASEDPDDPNHGDARRLLEGADPLATLDLASYEVTNVAVRAWRDQAAARRLCERVAAVADDGGLVRADSSLIASAALMADEYGISAYDAAYVAAARALAGQLVSCDIRDLVSQRLHASLGSRPQAGQGRRGGGAGEPSSGAGTEVRTRESRTAASPCQARAAPAALSAVVSVRGGGCGCIPL